LFFPFTVYGPARVHFIFFKFISKSKHTQVKVFNGSFIFILFSAFAKIASVFLENKFITASEILSQFNNIAVDQSP